MSKRALWSMLILCVGGLLVGCGSSAEGPEEPSPEGTVKPILVRLDDPVDVSLSALLTKSRAELATLADDALGRIAFKEKEHRDGQLPFQLLPQARVPRVVPVWRQAKYSTKAGMSLPP